MSVCLPVGPEHVLPVLYKYYGGELS